MRPGQPAYNEVLKIFGKDFLLPNGEFDRPKLGQVIFASKEKKRVLNRITHGPILKKIIIDSLGHLFKRGSPIVVLEVPLLFETFWLQFVCYPIIVIYMGDKEKWIKTLCQRDGINEEQANAKINAQMNIANKIKKAEFSLDNSGTKEELFKKLLDHLPDYFNFPPK
jgi:dephospho-CoA kinase